MKYFYTLIALLAFIANIFIPDTLESIRGDIITFGCLILATVMQCRDTILKDIK